MVHVAPVVVDEAVVVKATVVDPVREVEAVIAVPTVVDGWTGEAVTVM